MNFSTAVLLIRILKSVLTNKNDDFLDSMNMDFVHLYAFAKAHHLAGFVALCPEILKQMPPELAKKFIYENHRAVAREATQEVVISSFLDKMEEAGLRAMPLKGFYVKNFYPNPALRYMTDTDILIDEADIEKITPIMKSLGFEFNHETLHEIIFRSNQLVVELHKCLVHDLRTTLYDYYKDGWSFGKLQEGKNFIYKMSPEDTYVYTVTHLAKHYLEGGIGILHVADIYVLSRSEINREYVENELSKLGLIDFVKKVRSLAMLWFSDKMPETDSSVLEMADFILKSGAYGNDTNRTAAGAFLQEERLGKKQSNLVRIIKRTFVSPTHIKMLYPVVKKHRYLYPVFILVRIWDVLFKRKDTKQKLINMASTTDTEKDTLKKHFEKMGLPTDL